MWQPDPPATHADPDPEDSALRNAAQEIPQQTAGRFPRQSRFRTYVFCLPLRVVHK